MLRNAVIDTMMNRKSIRKYTDEMPSDEIIHTIVRAGQQAPFAAQMCSVILTRDRENIPWGAPISFIICVDSFKLEQIMAKRYWTMITNDLFLLLLGMQDASLMGENMVIAAESLGLGSCYIGMIPYEAEPLAKKHKLPKRVFPLVQLVMGYPAEDHPPRPRYPLSFTMFENEYPAFSKADIDEAMKVMDDGYLEQDYYRNLDAQIELKGDREERFTLDNYSWTEHISRKWGQWFRELEPIRRQFEKRGFKI